MNESNCKVKVSIARINFRNAIGYLRRARESRAKVVDHKMQRNNKET